MFWLKLLSISKLQICLVEFVEYKCGFVYCRRVHSRARPCAHGAKKIILAQEIFDQRADPAHVFFPVKRNISRSIHSIEIQSSAPK